MTAIVGLLFCNVLWSLSYPVSKSLMLILRPSEIAFLRNFFALIALTLIALCVPRHRKELKAFPSTIESSDYRLVWMGILTFFASPLLQMLALSKTRAIDSSLMIALEPLITMVLALFFFKERLRNRQILSIIFALYGAYVLSDATVEKLTAFQDSRIVGNSILILAMVFEAMVSVLSKPLLKRRKPVLVTTLAVFLGAVCMFIYHMLRDPHRLAGLQPLYASLPEQPQALFSIAFLGFGCTAFGYLYWLKVLPKVPLSIMALTLYLQPVLGMVWGKIFLDESLTLRHLFGATIVLIAVFIGTSKVRSLKAAVD